ncbi:MAG: sensor histidine kinase [Anaerolineae bacterium]
MSERLNAILDEIVAAAQAEAAAILLVDESDQELKVVTTKGVDPETAMSNFREVIAAGEAQVIGIADIPGDGISKIETNSRVLALAPLKAGDRIIGSLMVAFDRSQTVPALWELLLVATNYLGMALELERVQELLVQTGKLAEVGRVAANVIHELNNSLAVILTYSQILIRELEKINWLKKDLEKVKSEAIHARELSRTLLDFNVEEDVQIQKTNLRAVIDSILSLVRQQAKDSSVEIAWNYPPSLPQVQVNVEQMKQVFLNLINNALQAMPEGGRLTIGANGVYVESQEMIQVQFSDTGRGIPPERIPSLFKPFFTTKTEDEGTGPGLPISLDIVRRHGGDILVESEVGRGSTFTVRLPVLQR